VTEQSEIIIADEFHELASLTKTKTSDLDLQFSDHIAQHYSTDLVYVRKIELEPNGSSGVVVPLTSTGIFLRGTKNLSFVKQLVVGNTTARLYEKTNKDEVAFVYVFVKPQPSNNHPNLPPDLSPYHLLIVAD